MLTVNQEWDPLKVCVVGKSYPPEFYSFMQNPRLRNLFEKIATEVEEDLQGIVKILEKFNVEVLRPSVPQVVPQEYVDKNLPIPAPVSAIPRDQMIMIGNQFFVFPYDNINEKVNNLLNLEKKVKNFDSCWNGIADYVAAHGNPVVRGEDDHILALIKVNGIYRVGKDLIYGSRHEIEDRSVLLAVDYMQKKWLQDYNCHAVATGGHVDGCMSALKPGLMFSIFDMDYRDTFPGWEVVYFENSRLNNLQGWANLKAKNHGKWFIPGADQDDELVEYVEHWLKEWVGYVEETVFDVNLLMIDQQNAIVTSYDEKAFKAMERHGITPHIAPLRHRFFFDGGIHCSTAELHREGDRQTFF
jgi:hypothetical protein